MEIAYDLTPGARMFISFLELREIVSEMSDENVTLDLLGARLSALTAQVHDLEQRFAGLAARQGVRE